MPAALCYYRLRGNDGRSQPCPFQRRQRPRIDLRCVRPNHAPHATSNAKLACLGRHARSMLLAGLLAAARSRSPLIHPPPGPHTSRRLVSSVKGLPLNHHHSPHAPKHLAPFDRTSQPPSRTFHKRMTALINASRSPRGLSHHHRKASEQRLAPPQVCVVGRCKKGPARVSRQSEGHSVVVEVGIAAAAAAASEPLRPLRSGPRWLIQASKWWPLAVAGLAVARSMGTSHGWPAPLLLRALWDLDPSNQSTPNLGPTTAKCLRPAAHPGEQHQQAGRSKSLPKGRWGPDWASGKRAGWTCLGLDRSPSQMVRDSALVTYNQGRASCALRAPQIPP